MAGSGGILRNGNVGRHHSGAFNVRVFVYVTLNISKRWRQHQAVCLKIGSTKVETNNDGLAALPN